MGTQDNERTVLYITIRITKTYRYDVTLVKYHRITKYPKNIKVNFSAFRNVMYHLFVLGGKQRLMQQLLTRGRHYQQNTLILTTVIVWLSMARCWVTLNNLLNVLHVRWQLCNLSGDDLCNCCYFQPFSLQPQRGVKNCMTDEIVIVICNIVQ